MPKFRHRRTGREIDVPDADAHRYHNSRWEPADQVEVPQGTVAEIIEWAGDDPTRRALAVAAEKAGKKRKGILDLA